MNRSLYTPYKEGHARSIASGCPNVTTLLAVASVEHHHKKDSRLQNTIAFSSNYVQRTAPPETPMKLDLPPMQAVTEMVLKW